MTHSSKSADIHSQPEVSIKIYIHADDYGVSEKNCEDILTLVREGVLDSLSIMGNSPCFDEAAKKLSQYPHVSISVHLNLVEGRPVSAPASLPDLTDSSTGCFNRSFVSMLFTYLLRPRKRTAFVQQIEQEISAQIANFKEYYGTREIRVDSHTHIHMLPFVFNLLLAKAEIFNIAYMRLTHEPLFIRSSFLHTLKNLISPNTFKLLLLNLFTTVNRRSLINKPRIVYNKFFIGSFYTGNMNHVVVRSGLKRIKKMCSHSDLVEILFHPGGISEHEYLTTDRFDASVSYYRHVNRKKEYDVLLSEKINKVCQRYR